MLQKWACSRQGHSSKFSYFRITLHDDGRWGVSAAELKHNHEMIHTNQSCFMSSNRGLTKGDITGLRQCNIVRYFTHISGGIQECDSPRGICIIMLHSSRNTKTGDKELDSNGQGVDEIICSRTSVYHLT